MAARTPYDPMFTATAIASGREGLLSHSALSRKALVPGS